MKAGNKAQFTADAPLSLTGVHGSASVLTVTGVIAGAVFLRQDRTGVEFIAGESDVQVLAADDACVQALIYQAHIDDARRKYIRS